mmetsp:Transcript_12583/g.36190  ORF Transcript_12583/g.36190 Transcript_12583/m.36190 type:complete len:372 (-) Transcript_12583:597-1712(-)
MSQPSTFSSGSASGPKFHATSGTPMEKTSGVARPGPSSTWSSTLSSQHTAVPPAASSATADAHKGEYCEVGARCCSQSTARTPGLASAVGGGRPSACRSWKHISGARPSPECRHVVATSTEAWASASAEGPRFRASALVGPLWSAGRSCKRCALMAQFTVVSPRNSLPRQTSSNTTMSAAALVIVPPSPVRAAPPAGKLPNDGVGCTTAAGAAATGSAGGPSPCPVVSRRDADLAEAGLEGGVAEAGLRGGVAEAGLEGGVVQPDGAGTGNTLGEARRLAAPPLRNRRLTSGLKTEAHQQPWSTAQPLESRMNSRTRPSSSKLWKRLANLTMPKVLASTDARCESVRGMHWSTASAASGVGRTASLGRIVL